MRSPERHQPQHGRAIGDDQQQRDHRSRHRQQRDVGSRERVRDVRPERRSASDLDAQVGGTSRGLVTHRLDRVVERETGQIGVHRYHSHPAATVVGQLQRTLMDRGEVGRAECVAVASADDDDGRDTVSAGKLCPQPWPVPTRRWSAPVPATVGSRRRRRSAPSKPRKRRSPRAPAPTRSGGTPCGPIFQILNN